MSEDSASAPTTNDNHTEDGTQRNPMDARQHYKGMRGEKQDINSFGIKVDEDDGNISSSSNQVSSSNEGTGRSESSEEDMRFVPLPFLEKCRRDWFLRSDAIAQYEKGDDPAGNRERMFILSKQSANRTERAIVGISISLARCTGYLRDDLVVNLINDLFDEDFDSDSHSSGCSRLKCYDNSWIKVAYFGKKITIGDVALTVTCVEEAVDPISLKSFLKKSLRDSAFINWVDAEYMQYYAQDIHVFGNRLSIPANQFTRQRRRNILQEFFGSDPPSVKDIRGPDSIQSTTSSMNGEGDAYRPLSLGSLSHPDCKPCQFYFHSLQGCKHGFACMWCHSPHQSVRKQKAKQWLDKKKHTRRVNQQKRLRAQQAKRLREQQREIPQYTPEQMEQNAELSLSPHSHMVQGVSYAPVNVEQIPYMEQMSPMAQQIQMIQQAQMMFRMNSMGQPVQVVNAMIPDQSQMTPMGSQIIPDQSQMTPMGSQMMPDQSQMTPMGSQIMPDQSQIHFGMMYPYQG